MPAVDGLRTVLDALRAGRVKHYWLYWAAIACVVVAVSKPDRATKAAIVPQKGESRHLSPNLQTEPDSVSYSLPIYAELTLDMRRVLAVKFWARMWGVDESLMVAVSRIENHRGIPDAKGPVFCFERAGAAVEVIPNIRFGAGSKSQADEQPPGTCLRYTQAIGVMQIVPDAWLGTPEATQCGVSTFQNLENAWANACLGVLIYRKYLYDCYGDQVCALGKYGGAVQAWTIARYNELVTRKLAE